MTAATEATEPDDIVDAELVDDDAQVRFLPAAATGAGAGAGGAQAYRITRDTVLVEGELPPRGAEQPAFTERDFTVPRSAKRRAENRGARNTRVNRDTTRARFAEWCAKEGRVAWPSTTTATSSPTSTT
ncbi:hypothetical protein [Streptomyces jeddahensis]|uniref:Uncharacterized protein n=1 Tax=Streptomyces jeddahensis TaxID=1716141 RepID=A0A177HJT7_9ACTN|nr:hypothetical protein [Streptomyces jeddahensis]OAH10870.1 hypothetical protein STSP_57120 [Streptomyces jeddahensis]